MEIEENPDQIFDFNYNIHPEIYSSAHNSMMWDCGYNSEEIISTQPSSSAAAASPNIISFQNSNFLPNSDTDYDEYNVDDEMMGKNSLMNFWPHDSNKRPCVARRSPLQAQNHVMGERKRRENLRQLFINLSKAVPGLKKLDKASLLEDAIDYLKGLKERVGVLEEEETKKSSINAQKCDSSHNEINGELGAPEIQARISDKHALIKIFCKKEMGLMSRIPCELEKIDVINIVDIRIMPFGEKALDITILAEMQGEFRGQVKDIVDRLHTVFMKAPTSSQNN